MPLLATANNLVDEWGSKEIGRLLTQKEIISDDTGDTKSDYDSALFSEDTTLVTDVEAELNRVLNRAEAFIRVHVENLYGWPIRKDGFDTEAHPILKYITLVIARYYMHDEAYRERIDEAVASLYERYEAVLKKIETGEIEIGDIDRAQSEITNYII
ncbi:phage protein Gp36 family protein [Gracilimonas sediminicola]|uniref:DUF1320 domain-containing protein n=1 Tax=Gracilimonas sediminicola TaxID=2952158 RepID=A0A9X2REX2_9BACT|nr:phage protein Gp36 family protein [Gracilimonas sediminicola]MCP9289994.1 DUF1320 domain-containing protein [Gracilimonas sediminicola]